MKLLGFEFPDERYYWLERDMWAQREPDGKVRIGITAFGVHLSGHFFMCRPKPLGTRLDQGATVAVAELNKSVSPAKVGDGTVYRLRVAAGTAANAANLCGKLRVAGENCVIVR